MPIEPWVIAAIAVVVLGVGALMRAAWQRQPWRVAWRAFAAAHGSSVGSRGFLGAPLLKFSDQGRRVVLAELGDDSSDDERLSGFFVITEPFKVVLYPNPKSGLMKSLASQLRGAPARLNLPAIEQHYEVHTQHPERAAQFLADGEVQARLLQLRPTMFYAGPRWQAPLTAGSTGEVFAEHNPPSTSVEKLEAKLNLVHTAINRLYSMGLARPE